MISPINRDGLIITQPGRLEELYYNAPVNEPLDRNIMATNVQQGIAPLYNEMANPNFYENMYEAPPMNLNQKKEAFANNLQTKKQKLGLRYVFSFLDFGVSQHIEHLIQNFILSSANLASYSCFLFGIVIFTINN